jgi:hypothetical protein
MEWVSWLIQEIKFVNQASEVRETSLRTLRENALRYRSVGGEEVDRG